MLSWIPQFRQVDQIQHAVLRNQLRELHGQPLQNQYLEGFSGTQPFEQYVACEVYGSVR